MWHACQDQQGAISGCRLQHPWQQNCLGEHSAWGVQLPSSLAALLLLLLQKEPKLLAPSTASSASLVTI